MPLTGGAGAEYFLHLACPMNSLEAVLSEIWTIYALSIPVVLAVSAAVAWFFSGRALKPFQEIAGAAGQITFENLDKSIVAPGRETEVQALVGAFNAMVKRLEQSFRQMRQFNADAAHELRTPLAILQGENEIALRSLSLQPEIRSLLISNLEELDRLTRIVNDMLTLAEAEAGTKMLDKRQVHLKPLLQELIEQVEPVGREKEIRIISEDLPDIAVNVDRLWIRRAILNVLDNAIRYSRMGGLIEVLGKVQPGFAAVAVRDYGVGISAHDLPRIFDRLYRADPSRGRNGGGAGLGLSLVRWIVEAHEGTIHVTSLPDAGTTFEIRLPLSEGNPTA
jgi:heavy metal sensor kinase